MNPSLSIQSVRFRQRRQGMALISVLAVLLLLTLLVVAFMGRATSARIGTANYKATVSSRILADTAVNLVQAQINEATLSTVTTQKTWGSQPGAIRTFASEGNLDTIYRLYSAPTRTTTTLSDLANDLPTSADAWVNAPAQWVDLNASAKDAEGNLHFPILDARNPANLTTPLVIPGFSIAPTAPATATQMAPMPVRWLYVLKDGTLISPDASSGPTSLTFNSAAVIPTVKNPIVGRIAYWTDDDSSKVNINTASGDDVVRGTHTHPADSIFWSTPMFASPDEQALAFYQPAKGEFQRYSGHPGTVGLNSLLSALCGMAAPFSQADFYGLLPRYGVGGSQSATIPILNNGGGAAAIAPIANRMYTSVAEMLFTAGATRTASRLVVDSPSPAEAAAGVERANFFLTAHSRAPELNLWGEPRVSIWPVASTTANRTVEDTLLSFDASIQTADGLTPFYFQRVVDATDTNPGSASSSLDATIPGNVSLLKYLDGLSSSPIPGFGGSFTADKYPNTSTPPAMRQILTEIFDYIRTTNMTDPSATSSQLYGSVFGGRNGGYPNNRDGLYQVVPSAVNTSGGIDTAGSTPLQNSGLNNWKTQGNGAFPVLVEADLQFVAMGLGRNSNTGTGELPIPVNEYHNAYALSNNPAVRPNLPNSLAHDYVYWQDTSNLPAIHPPTPPTGKKPNGLYGDAIMDDDLALGGTGLAATIPDPTDPTDTKTITTAYAGRPADDTTAMQAILLLNFVNPSVSNSISDPSFCVSVNGLNGVSGGSAALVVNPGTKGADPYTGIPNIDASITLGFPGRGAAVPAAAAATGVTPLGNYIAPASTGGVTHFPISRTETTSWMVINADMVGCWNGSNCFGLIPSVFMTGYIGYGNYTPLYLGPSDPKWNSSARQFPFYSQLFCVQGQPPLQTFGYSAFTIYVTVMDAHKEGQTLPGNSITKYTINFPATTGLPIPSIPNGSVGGGGGYKIGNFSSGGGRVIGTGTGGDPATQWQPDVNDRWAFCNNIQQSAPYAFDERIDRNDVVEGMVLSAQWSDPRDMAIANVPSEAFVPHPSYGLAMAHNIWLDNYDTMIGNAGNDDNTKLGRLVKNVSYSYSAQIYGGATQTAPPQSKVDHANLRYPVVTPMINGAFTTVDNNVGAGGPGDWDNGFGNQTDGPWLNKADEGSLPPVGTTYPNYAPYYTVGNGFAINQIATFSPDRMMPSPAMFGSLPTGVDSIRPKAWQTLLFRPGSGVGGTGKSHPGEPNQPSANDPADHLLLDLFWMPQAEPYPISEPYSTAGKINLNYEIQPFTYITRATALRALLAGEKVAVMPDSLAGPYKTSDNNGGGGVTANLLISATSGMDVTGESRLPIDPDETLGLSFSGGGGSSGADTYGSSDFSSTKDPHNTADPQSGLAAWYDAGLKQTRFFKSPSELCEMFMVPLGYNWTEFSGASFDKHSWYAIPGDFALVGDNTRERPYVDMYSRVTTKSNTFTVFYTVQALKNAQPQTDAKQATWDETKGAVLGEYRGSNTLERYLDPHETITPDPLNAPAAMSLESYYKWRIVETHQFAP